MQAWAKIIWSSKPHTLLVQAVI